MCLIFVAWWAAPRYRLVVAANRDEFHVRPTAPAAPWANPEPWEPAAGAPPARPGRRVAEAASRTALRGNGAGDEDEDGDGSGNERADCPGGGTHPARWTGLLAGRDLEAGGTWLGVTADGRFAALTNFRAAPPPGPDAPSRGRLAADYLLGGLGAREQARRVAREAGRYRGFSLLLADRSALYCVTNRGGEAVVEVPPGCHGLSNDRLNAPWPKVTGGLAEFRRRMRGGFEAEDLFALLADDEPAAEGNPQAPGLERAHSARFVRGEVYGTRSSTVVCIGEAGAIAFEERSFDPSGAETGRAAFVRAADEGAGFVSRGPAAAPGQPSPAALPFPAEAAGRP